MRISDWSSDVCSSDLKAHTTQARHRAALSHTWHALSCSDATGEGSTTSSVAPSKVSSSRRSSCLWQVQSTSRNPDRKSVVSGKSVSVRVDLGGRRTLKKKKKTKVRHKRKN